MTRDRGYPDWLVLSARLLAQPSCGQVGGAKYICLITFPCGYVKILQPVAICTVIFVTIELRVFPPFSRLVVLNLIRLCHIWRCEQDGSLNWNRDARCVMCI